VGFANINAKAEGIESKPAFREAFQRRRCLVPVENFYEWKKKATGKQPYAIALAHRGLMALAGLWENWRSPAGRMDTQLRDRDDGAKRAVRRASQSDASDPCARDMAGVARRGAGGPASAQSPSRSLPIGGNDVLAGECAGRQTSRTLTRA
jgi:hypothetical protein